MSGDLLATAISCASSAAAATTASAPTGPSVRSVIGGDHCRGGPIAIGPGGKGCCRCGEGHADVGPLEGCGLTGGANRGDGPEGLAEA